MNGYACQAHKRFKDVSHASNYAQRKTETAMNEIQWVTAGVVKTVRETPA